MRAATMSNMGSLQGRADVAGCRQHQTFANDLASSSCEARFSRSERHASPEASPRSRISEDRTRELGEGRPGQWRGSPFQGLACLIACRLVASLG